VSAFAENEDRVRFFSALGKKKRMESPAASVDLGDGLKTAGEGEGPEKGHEPKQNDAFKHENGPPGSAERSWCR